MMPGEAEAGSAEEQPARNSPARYASVISYRSIPVAFVLDAFL
jgi:hypothetical protein